MTKQNDHYKVRQLDPSPAMTMSTVAFCSDYKNAKAVADALHQSHGRAVGVYTDGSVRAWYHVDNSGVWYDRNGCGGLMQRGRLSA